MKSTAWLKPKPSDSGRAYARDNVGSTLIERLYPRSGYGSGRKVTPGPPNEQTARSSVANPEIALWRFSLDPLRYPGANENMRSLQSLYE